VREDEGWFMALPEGVKIVTPAGEWTLEYGEIIELLPGERELVLQVSSGEFFTLSSTDAPSWNRFLSDFHDFNRKYVQASLLMKPGKEKLVFKGIYSIESPLSDSSHLPVSSAEFYLYSDHLVIVPEQGDLLNVFYADISKVFLDEVKWVLVLEFSEQPRIQLYDLSIPYPFLKTKLEESMVGMERRFQDTVEKLFPTFPRAQIYRLSRIMSGGRVVNRKQMETVAPGFCTLLENATLTQFPERRSAYEFLLNLSGSEDVYWGILDLEKSASEGLSEFFYLTALQSVPVVAWGIPSEKDGMTYFFRCSKDEKGIRFLNRGLLTIYPYHFLLSASQEEIGNGQWKRYRIALLRRPEVRYLREKFAGQARCDSFEHWRKSVQSLLSSLL